LEIRKLAYCRATTKQGSLNAYEDFVETTLFVPRNNSSLHGTTVGLERLDSVPCFFSWSARILFVVIFALPTLGVAGDASICGQVIDSSTLAPVALAACFLFNSQGIYTGLFDVTDAQGDYCIDGIAPGTYTLQILHDDYGEAVVEGILVEDTATGVDVGLASNLFLRTWPNPADRLLRIQWRPAGAGASTIEIFDVAGRRVNGWRSAEGGTDLRDLTWDLRDWQGRPVANGSYFVRLRSSGSVAKRRIILVR